MGLFSGLGNLLGKKDKVNAPATPSYYTDPNFSGAQDFLKNYSEGILNGNIPDYYKGIGQTMDPSLMKDYVYSMAADTQQGDLARGALSGRARTGMSGNTIATVGNLSAQARMQDYMNSLEGKKWLMSMGMGGEQDVRNSAFGNMGDTNTFNQWKYSADLAQEKARAAQSNAFTSQRWAGADEVAGAIGDSSSMFTPSAGTQGMSMMPTEMATNLMSPAGTSTKASSIPGQSPVLASGMPATQTKSSGGIDWTQIMKMAAMLGGA